LHICFQASVKLRQRSYVINTNIFSWCWWRSSRRCKRWGLGD